MSGRPEGLHYTQSKNALSGLGQQLGHQLTEAALHLATTNGANAVFLLTTTAERFFPQFGFEQIDREQVPPSVRASVEFQSACPASAIVMRKQLSTVDVPRRLAAESIGTAMLLAAVVGSGIMADRLSGGNDAIALLANTIATAAALTALISTFGPISGAHFNPAVSIADASQGGLRWRDVPAYVLAQMLLDLQYPHHEHGALRVRP